VPSLQARMQVEHPASWQARLLLALALCVCLAVGQAARMTSASGAGDGLIAGQLVDRTHGASAPAGQPVTLVIYNRDGAQIGPRQTTAGAHGSFAFGGLATDPALSYVLTTPYRSVPYAAGPLTLTPAAPRQQATLRVYEITHDPSVLRAGPLALVAT